MIYIFTDTTLKQIPLTVSTIGSDAKRNDKTVSVDYTEEVVVQQTAATANVSVQPYLYGVFDGQLTLSPSSDVWFSTAINPVSISPFQPLPIITPPVPIIGPLVNIQPVTGVNPFGFAPITMTVDNWFDNGVSLDRDFIAPAGSREVRNEFGRLNRN
jgi:hypothetical protein